MNNPADDFLTNYLFYTSGNEVPKAYHLWSGIGALSALIGRGVWIDAGIFTTHCNMYIILVGDPASKKSTGMNVAKKIVRDCGVKLAPSSVTKQRIYELMDKKNGKLGFLSTYTYEDIEYPVSRFPMFPNEIVTTLSAGGDPLGMVEFLTDIWESEVFDTDTKNAGSNLILGAYLTILGCMTPGQTSALLKQDIITGGFSRRCILVSPEKRRPPAVAFPSLTQAQEHARARCVEIGKELMQTVCKFDFTDEARVAYANWYEMNHARMGKTQHDVLLYYYGSLPKYILQVAMLLELSASRQASVITDSSIARAITYLEPIQHNLFRIFAGSGRNLVAGVAAKILTVLERSGSAMTKKALHFPIFNEAPTKEFDEALEYLTKHGMVKTTILSSGAVTFQLPPEQAAAATLPDQTSGHMFEQDLEAYSYPMPSDYQPPEPAASPEEKTDSTHQASTSLQSLVDIDLSDLADLNLDTELQ